MKKSIILGIFTLCIGSYAQACTKPYNNISAPLKPSCTISNGCSEWEIDRYNDEVEQYYRDIEEYNDAVERYNDCLMEEANRRDNG